MQCKAYCNGEEQCKSDAVERGYCYEHHRQERGLYRYYKAHEWEYEQSRKISRSFDGGDELAKTHYHLNIAVCAREIHAEWFYHNDGCESHETHIRGLNYDLWDLQQDIYSRRRAILLKDVESTKTRIKEGVIRVGENWNEEDDPCDMYGEMPNIEITSPETPDAIYRPSPRGWDPESEEIDTYDDSEVVW